MEKAIFAAGCFWHVEHSFSKLKGVIDVVSGYTGGSVDKPNYGQVCSGKTGHVEAVLVKFDSKKISYKNLLKNFWKLHDPTRHDGQGADVGSQYKAGIFYFNNTQKKLAEESKKEIEESGIYKKKIVTRILEAKEFFRAEEYHQNYFEKHKLLGFVCG